MQTNPISEPPKTNLVKQVLNFRLPYVQRKISNINRARESATHRNSTQISTKTSSTCKHTNPKSNQNLNQYPTLLRLPYIIITNKQQKYPQKPRKFKIQIFHAKIINCIQNTYIHNKNC